MKALSVLVVAFVLVLVSDAWAADTAPKTAAKVTLKSAASQPVAAQPAEDVVSLVGVVAKLFKDGAYRPAVGALITLILFLWRRFLGKLLVNKIPQKHLGWFTAVLGVLAAIPAALSAEPWSWSKFAIDALLISGPAVLFWTTLGKMVLPKVFGALPEKRTE